MPGPLSHTKDHKNSHTSNCAAPSPPAFKTIRDHDEHKFGGKNQFRNALPMVMIRLLITFRYFTIGTQNGLGKKIIVIKKKKDKRQNLCNVNSYNKTFTRVTVFCYNNTLQNGHVFCQRAGRGVGESSEKEMRKRTKPNKFCSSGTFQVIIKQVCYTMFSKKMCSKANMITFLFKKAQSSRSPL